MKSYKVPKDIPGPFAVRLGRQGPWSSHGSQEAADAHLRIAAGRGEAPDGSLLLAVTKPGRGVPSTPLRRDEPPDHVVAPYAVELAGGWRGAQSAREARTVAWEARGGVGGTPPPIWHRHPEGGWVLLAPGPPKTSGPSGRKGANPILWITLRDNDLATYQSIADLHGISVHDWARRVLREAATAARKKIEDRLP